MLLAALAGVVLLIVLWGSFYQVEPEEVGLVLRFGRHVRTTEPGLRFKIPLLEALLRFRCSVNSSRVGFRTIQAGIRSQFSEPGQYKDESIMLTGDLNVAVVEWIVSTGFRSVSLSIQVRGLEHFPQFERSRNERCCRRSDCNGSAHRGSSGD
jgi:regulator of protease activity HflC (stomatin/prohibitin superfamily)